MAFLTFTDLKTETFQKAELLNESRGFSRQSQKVIFLSYRRKDKNLVVPVVKFLLEQGVKLYIDFIDDNLPDKPSSAAAAILRERIIKSDKFILLATPNSSDSKWIPWELGLGDGFDGYENAIILPITEYSHRWTEQEYYEIYGYVEKVASTNKLITDWAIFYPHKKAIWLKDWLQK